MNKFIFKISIFFAVIILNLQICKLSTLANTKTPPHSIQINSKEEIVGNIPEANLILLATRTEGELTNFKLKIGKEYYTFPKWMNVLNRDPELYYNDINQDNKNEIIIVLTINTGTEITEQEAHVFNEVLLNNRKYEEKQIQDPMRIIKTNVKTKLTKSEAIVRIGNRTSKVSIKKFGIDPSHLNYDVAIGGILKYKVINDSLVAIASARIAPSGGYIGDIYITYTFKDDLYQFGKIRFVERGFE